MQPSERENIPPNDDVLRIVPGVPFYPFETVTANYKWADFVQDKEVPWDEVGNLYLRRKFSFDNIEGYIDVVNELFLNEDKLFENPLGRAEFVTKEEDGLVTYEEEPTILRLCFFLKSQRDYVSLSRTGISLSCPDSQYYLAHTYPILAGEILHALDNGEEVPIVERYFVEIEQFIKTMREVKEPNSFVQFDVKHLWFPTDIESLRKIKLTFEKPRKKDDDKFEEPPNPPVNEREFVTV